MSFPRPRSAVFCCLACGLICMAAAAAEPAVAVRPWILPSAVGVVVLRPQQMLLRAENKGESVAILAARFRRENGLAQPFDLLLRTAQHFDLPLQEIEEASYVLQELKLPERLPIRGWPVLDTYVIRASRPLDPAAASQLLFRARPQRSGGKLYWGQGKDDLVCACALVDDRTLVLGPETIVRKLLAAPAAETALRQAAAAFRPQDDISIAFDFAAAREANKLLGELGLLGTIADNATFVTLKGRLGPEMTAIATLDCKSPEAARVLDQAFDRAALLLSDIAKIGREENARSEGPPVAKAAQEAFFELGVRLPIVRKSSIEGTRLTWEIPAAAGLKLTRDLTAAVSFQERLYQYSDNAPLPRVEVRTSWFDAAAEKAAAAKHGPIAGGEVAAAVRRAFPAAAAMSIEQLAALAQSPRAPQIEDQADQPLALFWLCDRLPDAGLAERMAERAREFRGLDPQRSPKPSEMAAHMSISMPLGYCGLVQFEDITRVTAKIEGETARGVIDFEVPRLVAGSVGYEARRIDGLWELVAFELRGHGVRCVRSDAGTWELHHDLGRFGAPIPKVPVGGTIRIDGRPAAGLTVELVRSPLLWEFTGKTGADGKFNVELPVGKYFVALRGDRVPERFHTVGTSGLQAEVNKINSVLVLDLQSK